MLIIVAICKGIDSVLGICEQGQCQLDASNNHISFKDQESFEEELAVHALSKEDDDVLLESNRNGGSSDQSAGSTNHRTSLSAASSNDSLHSESNGGGSQTYHRYYHVFKEGELDYLINTYVDNLHIINSYYDHANWCIVAEKVNVWTI